LIGGQARQVEAIGGIERLLSALTHELLARLLQLERVLAAGGLALREEDDQERCDLHGGRLSRRTYAGCLKRA
jgi:hypothetical protein